MKNLLYFLLFSLSLCCVAQKPAAPAQLRYSFDLSDPSRIHVSLTFTPAHAYREVLLLPSQWAGETDLHRAITNLRAPDATLESTSDPARWLLRPGSSAPVTITYDLTQDWSGPLKHPLEHRVILRPGLFEFNGETGLVAPPIPDREPVDLTLDFSGLPPGYHVLTSFGTELHQHFSGSWTEVRNALFTGGEMSTQTLDVQGQPVLLAMHGQWSLNPADVANAVRRIIGTERQLWNDTAIPFYAIVIAPYDDTPTGGGGSSFTNISNLFLANRESFSPDTASLLAHEIFHHWNPGGLGSVDDTLEIAWFGEGFTSFYQDTVLVRSGLLTPEAYLARLNTTIRDYLLSPRIHLTNADLQRTLASDHFATEEPYLRGAVIALWLSSEINRQSGGRHTLTDLMFALRSDHSQPLTANRIFRTAARFVDPETLVRLRSFALDGVTVPVVPGGLGPCVAFVDRPAWTFDLGFDVASLRRAGIVRGVKQGSNAWQAGVRDGQQLGGFSLWNGNAEREVALTLREPDGRRESLTFLPRGKLLSVPQAEPVAGCPTPPRIPD